MSTSTEQLAGKPQASGYYLTPDLSQRMDLIKHLLANTALTPYIQAIDGSGKSRLAEHLLQTLNDRYTVDLINGASVSILSEIQKHFADMLGIASAEEGPLTEYFSQLAEQRKNYLLILDDADQMSAEGLTWLMAFFKNYSASCHCKLVILASLDVLALPLSPVMAAYLTDNSQALDIPRFTAAQIPAFVRSVNEEKALLLKEADYQNLFKNTSGNPGKILWLMQYIDQPKDVAQQSEPGLEPGLAPGLGPAGKKPKLLPWMGAAAIGMGLVTILIFQDEINKIVENKPADKTAEKQQFEITIPPRPQKLEISNIQQNKVLTSDSASISTSEIENQPLPVTESRQMSDESLAIAEQTIKPNRQSSISSIEDTQTKVEIIEQQTGLVEIDPDKLIDKLIDKQIKKQIVKDNTQNSEPVQNATEPSPIASQPAENSQKAVVKLPAVESQPLEAAPQQPSVNKNTPVKSTPIKTQSTTSTQVETAAVKTAKPEKTVKSPSKAPIPKGFRPLKWLTEQKKNTHTLQLTSAGDRKGIDRFINKHNLSGDLVLLITRRDNKPWYSLLYGVYPSRSAAIAASKKLPKSYKSSSAWARSILSVKQAGVAANR